MLSKINPGIFLSKKKTGFEFRLKNVNKNERNTDLEEEIYNQKKFQMDGIFCFEDENYF